jgi:outer membrane lipoprotein carrier protein
MLHVLGLVMSIWVAQASAPPNAQSVLTSVEKFYAGTKQVSATFAQQVERPGFGTREDSAGKVYLAKPGKMRWDYTDKKTRGTRSSFISNGKELYLVEKHKKQVTKTDLSKNALPVAVTFLQGTGKLSSEFNAAIDTSGKRGGQGDVVLELTPKRPMAQYKTLHLVVAKDDYRVKQSMITNAQGETTTITFYSPDFNKPIAAKLFDFDPRSVKDYKIIDVDQPTPQ